jgi:hypothetical protein
MIHLCFGGGNILHLWCANDHFASMVDKLVLKVL